MNPWRPYPVVRLLIPFLIGIITASFFGSQKIFILPVLIGLLVIIVSFYFLSVKIILYRYRWFLGVAIHISMTLAGFRIAQDHLNPVNHSILPFPEGDECIVSGYIPEQIFVRSGYFKAVVQLLYFLQGETPVRIHDRMLVYLEYDSMSFRLHHGNMILMQCIPRRIERQSNPGSFDFARHMKTKGILYQVYVKKDKWQIVSGNIGFFIATWATGIRDKMLLILKSEGLSGREFAVLSALLLGYKEEIDDELKRGYSASGATNILSVSGMHVGIVYLFLNVVLGFLNRKRWSIFLKNILLLSTIWLYALLTGLSPPVMRAATMLSLLIVGKAMKRNPQPLNIVAASAFILLIVDPLLVYDIGFQFSYMAVLSLVFFYKPIYDCYVTSTVVPDKIWSLIAASIAAQMMTFPIGLFYFHQFPNYFLVTNLVVIPLSALIIYTGILALILNAIPLVNILLGKMLYWLIYAMNSFILLMEELPFSVTRNIYPDLFQTILIFVVLTFLYQWFVLKRPQAFLLILGIFIIFQVADMVKKIQQNTTPRVVVYDVKKGSAYDFISGGQHMLLRDVRALNQYPVSHPVFQNHWGTLGLNRHYFGFIMPVDTLNPAVFRSMQLIRYGHFVQFRDCRILILDPSISFTDSSSIKMDMVILRDNIRISLHDIMKRFQPDRIIADPSTNPDMRHRWKADAARLKLPYYSVKEQGAFILNLK